MVRYSLFPKTLAAVLAISLFAFGCGDENGENKADNESESTATPINGIYKTTSHTENKTNCDSPGESVAESSSPYFKIYENSFFGSPIYGIYNCSAADSCDEKWGVGWTFQTRSGKNWVGEAESGGSSELAPGQFSCSISYATYTASPSGNELKLEKKIRSFSMIVDNDDKCDPALHKSHPDLACTSLETWIGTRTE